MDDHVEVLEIHNLMIIHSAIRRFALLACLVNLFLQLLLNFWAGAQLSGAEADCGGSGVITSNEDD
jgi:hypothetical protein